MKLFYHITACKTLILNPTHTPTKYQVRIILKGKLLHGNIGKYLQSSKYKCTYYMCNVCIVCICWAEFKSDDLYN